MNEIPQPSAFLQPDFKPDSASSTKPKPLTPNTFTGMVDTRDAAVERRFKGTFNTLGGTDLYNRRLQANLTLSREKSGGYAEWNRKRQEAINRGEDPNAELIAKIEARQPDSYLERMWRKLSGKKKTRAEEKAAEEAEEQRATEVCQGLGRGKEGKGTIR